VTDQEKVCRDCQGSFVFTAGEAAFFAEKGFTPPNRCKPCRDKRKAEKNVQNGGGFSSGNGGQAFRPAPEPVREYRSSSRVQPPPVPPREDKGGGRKHNTRRRRNDDYGDQDW